MDARQTLAKRPERHRETLKPSEYSCGGAQKSVSHGFAVREAEAVRAIEILSSEGREQLTTSRSPYSRISRLAHALRRDRVLRSGLAMANRHRNGF